MRGDGWLLALALGLTAVGLVMVYSSGSFYAFVHYHNANYFLIQQLFRTGLGLLVLFGLVRWLRPKWLELAAIPFFLFSCVLLGVVIVMGHHANGSTRWFRAGILSLQPTEIARVATVILLAWWLTKWPLERYGFWRGFVPPLVVCGAVSGLILKQPNLSSAGLLFVTAFVMLFLAGAKLRWLFAPVAAGVAAVALALATHGYQMGRVHTFVDFITTGKLDARHAGWQLDQSLIAIGSGGVLGRGLGAGMQKLLFLPEAHTDFIFSIIAEELGLLGSTALLVLIGLLVWRGMRVAARSKDHFAALVAGGLTVQIGLYALANVAVATGVAPTTGLPLPFVSYGGSALIVNLASIGLLFRISAVNNDREDADRAHWRREGA